METDYPEGDKIKITLEECPQQEFAVNLRYPKWAKSDVTVRVNGLKQSVKSDPGSFITLTRKWKKGDRIELTLPMSLYEVAMPDNADRRAVFYGPSLLAGTFGSAERKMGDIPVFVSAEKSTTNYVKKVSQKPLTFKTDKAGGPDNVTMIPFFKVYDQYQTVYWDVYSPEEWDAAQEARRLELERIAALDAKTLDFISLGEMQPERDHNFDGVETRFGEGYQEKFRMAYEKGWFAFDMKCDYNSPTQLLLTYYGGDARKDEFDIIIGDWKKTIRFTETDNRFVEFIIDLPLEVTKGKESINIKFQAGERNRVSNIYNSRLMKKQ